MKTKGAAFKGILVLVGKLSLAEPQMGQQIKFSFMRIFICM